jgi:TadE-like protein
MERALRAVDRSRSDWTRREHRGQSLVEFSLVLPILLMLVLAVSDFGRIFVTSVLLETAARDAAEAGAQEYVANQPGPLNAPSTGSASYYSSLAVRTAKVACAEARTLPNTDLDPADQKCKTWPVIRVCVHDGADPGCGQPIDGFASATPSQCSGLTTAWTNSQGGSSERWVEVRVCYKFSTIINASGLPVGDFYLERQRQFIIPCYFVLGASPCG